MSLVGCTVRDQLPWILLPHLDGLTTRVTKPVLPNRLFKETVMSLTPKRWLNHWANPISLIKQIIQ